MPKLSAKRRREIIRELGCVVPRCRGDLVELHHVRTAANSGVGMKPSDAFLIGLCHDHHRIGHMLGWQTFEQTYRLDLKAEAKKLAKIDREMP